MFPRIGIVRSISKFSLKSRRLFEKNRDFSSWPKFFKIIITH
jgi:hypothetical protein